MLVLTVVPFKKDTMQKDKSHEDRQAGRQVGESNLVDRRKQDY